MEILKSIWNLCLTNWQFYTSCVVILALLTWDIILFRKYNKIIKSSIKLYDTNTRLSKEYEASRNTIIRQEEIYHEAEAKYTTLLRTSQEHINEFLKLENQRKCLAGRLKKIDTKKMAFDLAIRVFCNQPLSTGPSRAPLPFRKLKTFYEEIYGCLKEK